MSFLQPMLLLAMPLIGIPIIIHLLNQRRHKVEPWAATRFVLLATNMNRGRAILRHWIVLALRSLAIAALIIAICRPLTGLVPGLNFFSGQREQLIVMDRSPSMSLKDPDTGLTWRQVALAQLQSHFQTLGTGGDKTLFHSHSSEPVVVASSDLSSLLETETSATPTDVSELIERALEHIEKNAVSAADIWVCTDRQQSAWQPESGRWSRIRERLAENPEVRLRVIYPEVDSTPFNLAVSASNFEVIEQGNRYFLTVDVSIQQTHGKLSNRKIVVRVKAGEIEKNIEVTLSSKDLEFQNIKLEIPRDALVGAGVVSLPADDNLADNQFYFGYAPQSPRNTVVISDDEQIGELLKLVCETPSKSDSTYNCRVLSTNAVGQIDFENTGLIVWHAPLPEGTVAGQLENFVADGKSLLVVPVDASQEPFNLMGTGWGAWEEADTPVATNSNPAARPNLINSEDEPQNVFQVTDWRGLDDLLASDESGVSLPISTIKCWRRRSIKSTRPLIPLASFSDGQPLLARVPTEKGSFYFLGTTLNERSCNLTDDGIMLYVMLHRALDKGSAAMSPSKQMDAGEKTANQIASWNSVKGLELLGNNIPGPNSKIELDQKGFHGGVFESDGKLIAINRLQSEDGQIEMDSGKIESLVGKDSFDLITVSTASLNQLTMEIWKIFVALMIVALLAEGWLSLPPSRRRSPTGQGGVA